MILDNQSFVSAQRRAWRMLLASLLVLMRLTFTLAKRHCYCLNILMLCLLLLTAGPARAQEFRGSLAGRVTDPSGAAVAAVASRSTGRRMPKAR